MVVDDEPDSRDALAVLLQRSGYTVITAANGAEAFAKAKVFRPCVVLLDLMMPVMSGYEFRRYQIADAQIGAVPVIVLTASRPSATEIGDLQAMALLRKPVDPNSLLDTLRRYC